MLRGGWKTESVYKQTYSYVFDRKADESINNDFSDLLKK